jgi:hypothetical protein
MSDFKIVKLLDPPVQILVNVTPKGEYNNSVTYVIGDLVYYNNSSYIAISQTVGNLPNDTSNWQLLGSSGIQEAYETVSKNILSWNATLSYTSGDLTSISYTDGVSTIVKTFNYTTGDLTSIVLSGDTPAGIDLIKTLGYTAGNLTSVTYS